VKSPHFRHVLHADEAAQFRSCVMGGCDESEPVSFLRVRALASRMLKHHVEDAPLARHSDAHTRSLWNHHQLIHMQLGALELKGGQMSSSVATSPISCAC